MSLALKPGPKARPAIERMLPRIIIDDHGCWPWPGATITSRGGSHYGVVSRGGHGAGMVLVHRASYVWFVGPIEYEIDHCCRNTLCWNPDHLRDVPHRVNQEVLRKEFCVRGHRLSENYYTRPDNGFKDCQACRVARRKEGR